MKNKFEVDNLYRIQQAAYSVEAKILGLVPDAFFPFRETIDDLRKSTDEIWVYLLNDNIVGAVFLEKSDQTQIISKLVVDPIFFRRVSPDRWFNIV